MIPLHTPPLPLSLIATDLTRAGLPPSGRQTPGTAAGFAFTTTPERLGAEARRVLVVADRSAFPVQNGTGDGVQPAGTATRARHIPRVALSGNSACTRVTGFLPSGGLELRITPDRAYVRADPADWPIVCEPVLLSIALCWRFLTLTEQLDELEAWARTACRPPRRWWTRDPLPRAARAARLATLRRLVLDLPGFEGPLIDARGYFASQRSVRLFQTLIKHLGLPSWRELIDERIEIVEATFEALAEEQRQGTALRCEIVLEVLIFAALLADIAINAFALSGAS